MFAITVTYVIRPGLEDAAARHFSACIAPTRAEPGNARYHIYRSLDEPRRFTLVEEYADEAAFETHRAAPYFQEHIREGVMTMMESRIADRCVPLADIAA